MCHRMQLDEDVTRILTVEEVDRVERMRRYVPNMFNATTVRCLNASCHDVGPFRDINALAYHMMVEHLKKEREEKSNPCLLCSDKYMTWTFLWAHIESEHGHFIEDHMAYREREADEQTGKRSPRKQKSAQSADGARWRSLSPEWSGEAGDQRMMMSFETEFLLEEKDDQGPPIEEKHDTNDTITLSSGSESSSPEPATQICTESPERKRTKWEWVEEFLADEKGGQEPEEIVDHHSKTALVAAMELPFAPRDHSTPERPSPQNRAGPKSITGIPYPEFSPLHLDDADDDVMVVCAKPGNLRKAPLRFTPVQRELLFSPLKPLDPNAPNGKHVCSECNKVVPDVRKGRRHMMTHARVIRFRCSLCGAGSFYRRDFRLHLMKGLCEGLHRAPAGMVKPNSRPCMTKGQADSLAEFADARDPSRVIHTDGKIVSEDSRRAYYPDPVTEERMLGTSRVYSLGFLG